MTKKNVKTPEIFSFQRLLCVTDGAFFNRIDGRCYPLPVIRHGIRGTQNTDNPEKDVANVQVTESAKTDARADALVVTFGLRTLNLDYSLFACLAEDRERARAARQSVARFVERARTSEGLREVARRIARNLASGSWLWRNRAVASEIEVDVADADGESIAKFDAFAVPTTSFGDYSADEMRLAEVLANGLRGGHDASIQVSAVVRFGLTGPVEVFPSQVYIEDKPKGFARALYKISPAAAEGDKGVRVMGQAALRDQKIANRLRAIDTWYPGYELTGKPLPVEPNGASLDFGEQFRPAGKNSAFSLFADLDAVDPNSEQGMYCIGMLIRGGVLGKAEEKKEKEKEKKAAQESSEAAEA